MMGRRDRAGDAPERRTVADVEADIQTALAAARTWDGSGSEDGKSLAAAARGRMDRLIEERSRLVGGQP